MVTHIQWFPGDPLRITTAAVNPKLSCELGKGLEARIREWVNVVGGAVLVYFCQ